MLAAMSLERLKTSGLVYGWIAVLIIVLDQWTKALASANLELHDPQAVMSFFNLTLSHNEGAAFSFLSQAGGWQRWFFTGLALGVSVLLLIWMARLERSARWEAVAISLILGGALGNVIDRVTLGYVVDFVDVYYPVAGPGCFPGFSFWAMDQACHWPAFNIADAGISVGAVMMVIDALFFKRGSQPPAEKAS